MIEQTKMIELATETTEKKPSFGEEEVSATLEVSATVEVTPATEITTAAATTTTTTPSSPTTTTPKRELKEKVPSRELSISASDLMYDVDPSGVSNHSSSPSPKGFDTKIEPNEQSAQNSTVQGMIIGYANKTNEDETTLNTDSSSKRWKKEKKSKRRRNLQGRSDMSFYTSTTASSNNSGTIRTVDTETFRAMSQEQLLAFSVNRLRTKLFKKSHLVGRDSEVYEMEQAFDHMSDNEQTSVVWISGASGTGKSRLANQLNIKHHPYHSAQRKQQKRGRSSLNNASTNTDDDARSRSSKHSRVKPKRGKYFFTVTSKFDLQFVNEPLACIKFAMTDLANQIMVLPRKKAVSDSIDKSTEHSTDTFISATSNSSKWDQCYYYYFDELKQQLQDGLGYDLLKLLSSFIPNLVDILDEDDEKHDKNRDRRNHNASNSGMLTPVDENSRRSQSHDIDDNDVSVRSVKVPATTGYKELSDQMKLAFQRFLQIVTSFCPLVWIADDLQWADQASLDMIRTWVSDVRITSFMLIGCRRDSKVDFDNNNVTNNDTGESQKDLNVHDDGALRKMTQAIRQVHEERNIKICEIRVDNLSLEHVNELIFRSLSASPAKTSALARVVYGKTHGNIFFTIQLLFNLAQQGLLRLNNVTSDWEWDDEKEIDGLTTASANVIESLKSKVSEISEARFSLPLAACLGTSFSWNTIKVVLDGFQANNETRRLYHTSTFRRPQVGHDDEGIERAVQQPETFYTHDVMKVCTEHGLLESRGSFGGTYHFVHDKVQEAALAVIPKEKLPEIRYMIGEILFTNLPPEELDENCFLVTNLMTPRLEFMVDSYDETNRWKLVRLNYLAGTKAVNQSAFLSALAYFGTSISLLPANHWKENHKMSLDLFSSAAECAYVIGDSKKAKLYCSEVLDLTNHHLTTMEKVRVCHVLIDSHMNEADAVKLSTETSDLCLQVLDGMGCSFPNSALALKVTTFLALYKAKRDARGWTQDTAKRLPICKDAEVSALAKTLSRFFMIAYMCKPKLIPLAIVKSVRTSIEKGATAYSAPAFACLAMIVGSYMGDFKTGENLALLSLQLVSKLRNTSRVAEAESIVTAYSLVLHWTKPIQSCRVPFLEAYQIGMRMGDTLSALWAALFYCEFSIGVGASLALIEAESLSFSKVAEDNCCTVQKDILSVYRKVTLNLQGKSSYTTELDVDETLNRYNLSGHKVVQVIIRQNMLTTMIFFGAFEECAELILKHGDDVLEKLVGQVSCLFVAYYGSLCCYIASRSTFVDLSESSRVKFQRRLLAKGDFFRKKLITWSKRGNPNCHHILPLVEAERLVSKSRSANEVEVIKSYEESISISSRKGIIQDQALANERMAEFYFHQSQFQGTSTTTKKVKNQRQKKDGEGEDSIEYIDEAMYRFGEAKRLYKEWGADAVVEKVEERCRALVGSSRQFNL